MVYPAVEASDRLKKEGIAAGVVNARFVKPLDAEMIIRMAGSTGLLVTVEEAYLAAGFGSAVIELLEQNAMQDKVKVVRMGVTDEIVTHGDPKDLLAKYGLDATGIYDRVKQTLNSMEDQPANKRLRAVK
jgi:1-deoxy-D-xylulose-5-phosphate synthase